MQLTNNNPNSTFRIPEVLIQGVQTIVAGFALLIMSIIIVGQGIVIAGKLGEMLFNLARIVFGG